jgi:CPA2 family monovalent cation:H+ antiporter-2
VGEFSFVLTAEARRLGIMAPEDFQTVLAAAAFSMLATPVVIRAARGIIRHTELPGATPVSDREEGFPERGHVVILGFGFNGRNLARVLRETSIPYVVVDLNAMATREAAGEGHPVLYGDGARAVVLEKVNVGGASAVVVVIDDAAAVRRVVQLVRERNRTAALIVRTRYVAEIEELYRLGADEVVPEEMETSIELFARVLQCLDVPKNVIAAQVDVVRSEHYAMLRGSEPSSTRIESIYELFTAATTATHLVRAGSPAISRTVREIDLAAQAGVTLVAVVRKGTALTNPSPDYLLERGDILVVLGNHAQLTAARRLLEPTTPQ